MSKADISDSNEKAHLTQTNGLLIRSHQTEIDIYSPQSLLVTETFSIQNLNTTVASSVDLWFNHSLNTLVAEDVEGALSFDWIPVTNVTHFISIYFRTPLEQNDTSIFSVSYNLDTELILTESEPSFYSFEFYSTISHFTRRYTMSMILPELSFIHESEVISPYYPVNATQILIKNRIVISWIFNNVSQASEPFFLLRFDEPIIPETDEPFFKTSFNVFLMGIITGIFLGISGTSWLIRYREKKAMKKLGRTLLTDTQKALIKIVYEKEGKISQRDLCDTTGFSKSKVSRNLVPLEMRGLIRREKWGRTYVVYLTDDGRTVIE
ncbi:MAG: helix-turn-helix transcriptional regulator [Candidatus Heimdallarchaeaceae archaeon]|jgi:uncharacterized membrane protein